jgi:hypothetical protein
VYEYGTEGPAILHAIEQRLDGVVRDTPWEVWNGDEADWLQSTGWLPLKEWHSTLLRDYPPWATTPGPAGS